MVTARSRCRPAGRRGELCRSMPRALGRAGRRPRSIDRHGSCRIECRPEAAARNLRMADERLGFAFATLVVEERPAWLLTYRTSTRMPTRPGFMSMLHARRTDTRGMPSISGLVNGPSVDWHEREVEDLFGLTFEGHPRLGEFVLHEDWPEGVNPMRHAFRRAAAAVRSRTRPEMGAADHRHRAGRLRHADRPGLLGFRRVGAFPAGDRRRGCHPHDPAILLQIPRRREDRRGPAGRPRAAAGRTVFGHLGLRARLGLLPGGRGDLRRSRRRRARRRCARSLPNSNGCATTRRSITGICNSTALAVATSQAALIEEELLRLSCEIGTAPLPVRPDRAGWSRLRSCRTSNAGILLAAVAGIGDAAARTAPDAALLEQLSRPSRGSRHRHCRTTPSPTVWSVRSRGLRAGVRHPQAVSLRRLWIGRISPCRSNRRATAMRGCASSSTKPSNRPRSSARCCARTAGRSGFGGSGAVACRRRACRRRGAPWRRLPLAATAMRTASSRAIA